MAIALDIPFMIEEGEHSYKISAGRLLRNSVRRREVFLEVKRIYDLRSAMVQTGRAHDNYNVNGAKRSAHDLVETVDVHCINAIRNIFGGISEDWREIELS